MIYMNLVHLDFFLIICWYTVFLDSLHLKKKHFFSPQSESRAYPLPEHRCFLFFCFFVYRIDNHPSNLGAFFLVRIPLFEKAWNLS